MPIWGEAPTALIETQICMVGHLADVITCAKCQDDIFRVTILQGVEFPIFLLIFAWALQQCSVTALPVISFIFNVNGEISVTLLQEMLSWHSTESYVELVQSSWSPSKDPLNSSVLFKHKHSVR